MFSPQEVRSLCQARERMWPEIDQAAMGIPDHIFQRILERRSATLKSLEAPVQFIKKTKRQEVIDVSPNVGAQEVVDEEGNAVGCDCSCPECQNDDCANCSNENCSDPNCADARLSAVLKGRVAAALQSFLHDELPS